jgi:hypothetical protein
VARGITRSEQGQTQLAAQDFGYAANLYEQGGDAEQAKQLREAAKVLQAPANRPKGGNGIGSALMSGAAGLASSLAPLAMKFLVPALGGF